MSLDLKSNIRQNNLKSVNPSNAKVYAFEGFRLDAEHLMLYHHGDEVSLTPKQVETLLALVERDGEIVSKDILMERLWANAFVEESNLVQNIYILRKTLGETSDGKPMIETLRRRGYRFNGDLKVSDQEQPEEAAQLLNARSLAVNEGHISEKADAVRWSGKTRTAVLVVAVAILMVVAIGTVYYLFLRPRTDIGSNRSIAVLPLKPIDPAGRRDLLLEIGIADSLINRLNSTRGFVVRSLSATRKYTEVEQEPIAAGREQKVDYVLASNYQLADGRIRITTQLINVATAQVEESYKFDKEAAGVFAIQDAVTSDVGNKLIARFGGTTAVPAANRGTSDEKAYQLYLDGMYLYDKRGANSQRSVEKLSRAVELDPNYALAWAGKGLAHFGVIVTNKADNTEEYQRSIEAINKALALDPDLSVAHSALCVNKYSYDHDFTGAERECRRALELDPNSSIAHQIYSHLLMSTGRPDEAITAIKTAIWLDPTSYLNQRTYANLLYYDRRYDEAGVQYKQLIDMGEQNPAVYEWFIRTLDMQGKEPEAFEWFIRSLILQKKDDETIGRFRAAYQTSGWPGVLLERDRTYDESVPNYFRRAGWNARIGNKDKAFEYLEISFQRHESVVGSILVEPLFDGLRDDPRYADLARRVAGR